MNANLKKVPPSFFGLSTETWSLPRYEVNTKVFERVLTMFHVPGDIPLLIRIGGDSADHTYWGLPKKTRLPISSFALTNDWFTKVNQIGRDVGLRFIVDLNLVANRPSMAADWAKAAIAKLPLGSVTGFEVGNEPDLYFSVQWKLQFELNQRVAPELIAPSVLAPDFSADDYSYDFKLYQQALARVAPGIPTIGPAVAQPDLSPQWIDDLVRGQHGYKGPGYVSGVSAHRYPLSICEYPESPLYPTVPRVLDEMSTRGMANSAKGAINEAHKHKIHLYMTELNSVTCGGREGVSNTFATSLWAPDALFELIRAGADTADIHIRADAINHPFYLGRKVGLRPAPLLYGILTFIRSMGPDAWLVPAQVKGPPGMHLKVWAVRAKGNVLRVLMINKGARPGRLVLNLPAKGDAAVERLRGPAPNAMSGVMLDGQTLGPDGTWQGTPIVPTIRPGKRGYTVNVPAYSAALLTVPLKSGALPAK
jgi:hypothetical protein